MSAVPLRQCNINVMLWIHYTKFHNVCNSTLLDNTLQPVPFCNNKEFTNDVKVVMAASFWKDHRGTSLRLCLSVVFGCCEEFIGCMLKSEQASCKIFKLVMPVNLMPLNLSVCHSLKLAHCGTSSSTIAIVVRYN